MKLALDSDPPSGSGTTSRIPEQTLVCVPSAEPNLLRGALVSCACSDKRRAVKLTSCVCARLGFQRNLEVGLTPVRVFAGDASFSAVLLHGDIQLLQQ